MFATSNENANQEGAIMIPPTKMIENFDGAGLMSSSHVFKD